MMKLSALTLLFLLSPPILATPTCPAELKFHFQGATVFNMEQISWSRSHNHPSVIRVAKVNDLVLTRTGTNPCAYATSDQSHVAEVVMTEQGMSSITLNHREILDINTPITDYPFWREVFTFEFTFERAGGPRLYEAELYPIFGEYNCYFRPGCEKSYRLYRIGGLVKQVAGGYLSLRHEGQSLWQTVTFPDYFRRSQSTGRGWPEGRIAF